MICYSQKPIETLSNEGFDRAEVHVFLKKEDFFFNIAEGFL